MNSKNIHPTLAARLQPAIQRDRWRRILIFVLVTLLTAAVGGVALAACIQQGWLPASFVKSVYPATIIFAVVGAILIAIATHQQQGVIEKLEAKYPALNSALLTAVDQQPEPGASRLNFLQEDVVRRAVYHSYEQPWKRIIPFSRLVGLALSVCLAFALFVTTTYFAIHQNPLSSLGSSPQVEKAIMSGGLDLEIAVEPGDASVEKGTSVLVLARFDKQLPNDAELIVTSKSGEQQKLEMKKSLQDPVFAARTELLDADATYAVRYNDSLTREYKLSVFEFPKLVRSDATLDYPDYTKLETKQLQDVRRLTAVQGTETLLELHLNKPVKSARLLSKDNEEIRLTQSSTNAQLWQADVPMAEVGKHRYELTLLDSENRKNKSPERISINVVRNQEPDLKLLKPSRDIAVSAIQELLVAANAWDDFGLEKVGIEYSIGDQSEELILAESLPARKKQPVNQLLSLEALSAKPNQLLTYHIFAEDIGPDGKPRRVASDMFFAEVRSFEEIFRQGQAGSQPSASPSGQPSGQQEQEQIAELQKQIINATWKIIRREKSNNVSDEFGSDVQLLVESQQKVLGMVEEAAAATGAVSEADLTEIKGFVSEAIDAMNKAVSLPASGPLKLALKREQSAYEAMLKMRPNESQVARQNQSQSQPSGGGRPNSARNQQLEQLEMKDQQDRYEQEQTATDTSDQTERELRQVLNRLRELARRQNDLNQRIKEMQSALEAEESVEEKKEIERQLKRLRDEQQQILRDAESLQERMEQEGNQQQMAEASERLEEARENIQQSSEALDSGDLAQAAAEGTRAAKDLKELRDDFQKQSSGQFTEQMRQMRNRAEDIEQEQNKIAEAMEELENENQTGSSLRENTDRDSIAQRMERQRAAIEELRESMKETIEEAEEFEPLLAEQLYDTFRQSEQKNPTRDLDAAQRAVENGFDQDAQRQERRARQGIQQLREGIAEAAESVLGDETNAIRVAENTLRQLSNELQQELKREDPGGQSAEEPSNPDRSNTRESQPGGSPQPNNPSREGESSPSGAPSSDESPQGNAAERGERGGNANSGDENQPRPSEENQPGNASGNQGEGSARGNSEGESGDQQAESQLRSLDEIETPGGNRGQGGETNIGGMNPNASDRDAAPLTGENFLDWSNRLRDVEEMINDPDLRAEAARIRDRAKEVRRDLKRHSKDPNWQLVRSRIAEPLQELQRQVTQELMRRSGKNKLVPIDRNPVPPKYESAIREYYRQLGSGQ